MLFIPFTTKSLISDGMSSAATALAAGPTLATGGAIKKVTQRQGRRIARGTINSTRNGFERIGSGMKNKFNKSRNIETKPVNQQPRKVDFKNRSKKDD